MLMQPETGRDDEAERVKKFQGVKERFGKKERVRQNTFPKILRQRIPGSGFGALWSSSSVTFFSMARRRRFVEPALRQRNASSEAGSYTESSLIG